MTKKEYWYGIDIWKGILIIFVFLSHVIPGEIRTSFGRYFIYSFHMPLFVGISGYLLKVDSFRYDWKNIIYKLSFRLLIPWAIVVFLYNMVNNSGQFILRDFLHSYIWPYYHLWYVPAYFFYYFCTLLIWKITEKCGEKRIWILLGISLIISICSKFQIWEYLKMPGLINRLFEYAEHDFKPFYYIYFVLGVCLRHQYQKKETEINSPNKRKLLYSICFFSFVGYMLLFCRNYTALEYIIGYIWGISFLLIVIMLIQRNCIPSCKVLEFLGKNSYPIYLYHAFIFIFFRQKFPETDVRYYILLTALFIVLCTVIWLLKKIRLVDRYLFGNLQTER